MRQRIARVHYTMRLHCDAMPSASEITIHEDDLLRSELLFYHSKKRTRKRQREEQKKATVVNNVKRR